MTRHARTPRSAALTRDLGPDRLVRGARRPGRTRPAGAAPSRCRRRATSGRPAGRGPDHDRLVAGRRRGRLPRPPRARPPTGRVDRSTTRRRRRWRCRTAPISTRPRRPTRPPGTPSRAVADHRSAVGALSAPVEARCPAARTTAAIDARASTRPRGHRARSRPWRPMVGSEHLALLLRGAGPGGHHVGDELAEAFRIVRDELGVRGGPRARASSHDSLGVYRDSSGRPRPRLRAGRRGPRRGCSTPGLRPIVELSFMPHDLAADPDATVFDYRGIISPPRDLRPVGLAGAASSSRHLVERFGADAVRAAGRSRSGTSRTSARVLVGTESDYLRALRRVGARVKAVDPAFPVGGPATAAVGWIDDLLAHCRAANVPARLHLDAHLRHAAARPASDRGALRACRPAAVLDRVGRLSDARRAASTTASGARRSSVAGCAPPPAGWMRCLLGRLGPLRRARRPRALLHGGFGLLTIGNLRKPRFWALRVLESLGSEELAARPRRRRRRLARRGVGDAGRRRPGRHRASGTARSTRRSRMAPASWDAT